MYTLERHSSSIPSLSVASDLDNIHNMDQLLSSLAVAYE
jgi:hypothetical protein